jgi:hypothetical protein
MDIITSTWTELLQQFFSNFHGAVSAHRYHSDAILRP